jgi:hypothetical protein
MQPKNHQIAYQNQWNHQHFQAWVRAREFYNIWTTERKKNFLLWQKVGVVKNLINCRFQQSHRHLIKNRGDAAEERKTNLIFFLQMKWKTKVCHQKFFYNHCFKLGLSYLIFDKNILDWLLSDKIPNIKRCRAYFKTFC